MAHDRSQTARASTTAQLKADIDAGRTGDKVSNADPGLSPLGTDDEAAGHPASAERIDLARRNETRIGAWAGPPVRDSTGRSGVSIALMIGVVVVMAVVVLGVVLLR